MSHLGAYKKQSLTAGWTRVEMLLEIYDRAMGSIEACQAALAEEDQASYAQHLLKSHKAIIAIHGGLKPDEHEVANNIARLLHFVSVCLEKNDFDASLKVLGELRDGYAAVADELNELERTGEIPPMPNDDEFGSTV